MRRIICGFFFEIWQTAYVDQILLRLLNRVKKSEGDIMLPQI